MRTQSKIPLPGLLKVYLASCCVTGAACGLTGGLFLYELMRVYYDGSVEFTVCLVLLVLAALCLGNIAAIIKRSPAAPLWAKILLGGSFAIGIIGSILVLKGLRGILFYTNFQAAVQIPVALFQGLVLTAAWYLYWQRSPKLAALFRVPQAGQPDSTPHGLQLTRLGAACIAATGLASALALFDLRQLDFFRQISWLALASYPVRWAVLGLALSALLWRRDKRMRQETLRRAALLLTLWLLSLLALHLAWFSGHLELTSALLLPVNILPLCIEGVLVLAMLWNLLHTLLAQKPDPDTPTWLKGLWQARAAGVRGLDMLYLPVLSYVFSWNLGWSSAGVAACSAAVGLGCLAALALLFKRPERLALYLRVFSGVALALFIVAALYAGPRQGNGFLKELLAGYQALTVLLLGVFYFARRQSFSGHPMLVLIRFIAWGWLIVVALLTAWLLLFSLGSARELRDGIIFSGFPWLYLPLALGVLFMTGREDKLLRRGPGPVLVALIVLMIALYPLLEFTSVYLWAYAQLSWELPLGSAALLERALEFYHGRASSGAAVQYALALCLWVICAHKDEPAGLGSRPVAEAPEGAAPGQNT